MGGPPANLGGPMAATQKTALGIVSDSEMPQFRGSKGVPIPPFKVAPLGKLDPKIARPMFNKQTLRHLLMAVLGAGQRLGLLLILHAPRSGYGAAEFDALEESAGVRDRLLFVSGRLQD